jgi:hypothetical protein
MSNHINTNEDIPGCEDNYYRCCLITLRVMRGWIDLFSTIILIITAILSAVSTAMNNSEVRMIIGIVITCLSGVAAGFRLLKDFTINEELDTKKLLNNIIIDYNTNNNKNNI